MRTTAHLGIAALAVATLAALGGHGATAEASKPCPQGKPGCASSLKAGAGKKPGRVEFEWKVEEGESSKRRKGLKAK